MTSYEVKKRYADKTYKRYSLTLRNDDDAELIALIEKNKANGIYPTETIKSLIK